MMGLLPVVNGFRFPDLTIQMILVLSIQLQLTLFQRPDICHRVIELRGIRIVIDQRELCEALLIGAPAAGDRLFPVRGVTVSTGFPSKPTVSELATSPFIPAVVLSMVIDS